MGLNRRGMCWCAIPRNPPVPAETPAMPQVIRKEVAKTAARGQLLGQIASALAAHGILPYLSRSYLLFFMIGSNEDAQDQFKQWGVPLTDGEVTYIDTHTAEMFLSTGGERETLAYSELRGLLKTAMSAIRANNRFADVAREQSAAKHM